MQSTILADRPGRRVPAAWIAGAVDALGSPSFLPTLLAGFNTLDGFPFLFAGRERSSGSEFAPCVGHRRISFESPAVLPLRTIDGDDPMRNVMRKTLARSPAGTVFVGCVDAHEIRNERRRELIFERNALATRIGMSVLGPDGARYFLCLYRQIGSDSGSRTCREELHEAGRIGLSLLRKHWALRDLALAAAASSQPLQACEALTERERQVCAGLLRGRTLPQLADMLGIRTSTARTYQQRAFARLGVRNRGELLHLVDSRTPL